jgi:hypothetical protein
LNAPVNQALVEFAHDIERGVRERGMHNYDALLRRIEELDALPATGTARNARLVRVR